MSANLQWSKDALEDFKTQIAYIADRNPDAAEMVARRVDECALKLAVHSSGRPGRVGGTFEKPVPGLPYIIAYAVSADRQATTITVLRLIHMSRDWKKGRWPE